MDEHQESVPFHEPVSSVSSSWSVHSDPWTTPVPSLRVVHRCRDRVWTEIRPTDLHKCLCGQRNHVSKLSNREFTYQYLQEIGYLLRSGTSDIKRGVLGICGVFAELFR